MKLLLASIFGIAKYEIVYRLVYIVLDELGLAFLLESCLLFPPAMSALHLCYLALIEIFSNNIIYILNFIVVLSREVN